MLGFSPGAFASFGHERPQDSGTQQLAFLDKMKTPEGAVNTDTARAVEASSDSTEVSPFAQAQSDLEALIERLTSATTSHDVAEALGAVKTFVNDNTNASMLGNAIDGLADMADSVLSAIEEDPSSFNGGFSFAFSANFSNQTIDADNFYSNKTSFSFSFSFSSEQTVMSGSMSFSENLKMNEQGLSYQATEAISMSVTTSNVNLESNPVLDAFADITNRLTGIDMAGLFEDDAEPAAAIGSNYRSVSVYERLQLQFSSISAISQANEELVEYLDNLREDALEQAA